MFFSPKSAPGGSEHKISRGSITEKRTHSSFRPQKRERVWQTKLDRYAVSPEAIGRPGNCSEIRLKPCEKTCLLAFSWSRVLRHQNGTLLDSFLDLLDKFVCQIRRRTCFPSFTSLRLRRCGSRPRERDEFDDGLTVEGGDARSCRACSQGEEQPYLHPRKQITLLNMHTTGRLSAPNVA